MIIEVFHSPASSDHQIAGQQHQALRDRIGLAAPTADEGGGKGCGENRKGGDDCAGTPSAQPTQR